MIAGIDFSTRAVDVVLLDEDTDAATWHRVELQGQDAFDRAREVKYLNGLLGGVAFWDAVVAIGIEDPRGYNAGTLYRIQGAILAELPRRTLVQPWIPSQWRKTVGLPGNASKEEILTFAVGRLIDPSISVRQWNREHRWPQDAYDAYCIALATRTLLHRTAAA